MIKIIGDVCLADGYFDRGCGIGTKIANGLDPFAGLHRSAEDYWIGNFECVCAERDCNFVIAPDVLKNVEHCNMYGIANNHAMQIGDAGYTQTIRFFEENSIDYVGSLNRKSTIFKHQGKTVGVIAFSLRPDNFSDSPLYWHLPELNEIESEIDCLEYCDYRIAFIHWGYEFINYPNLGQRQLAHWLVDKGIDLVVGMHPHVAQGGEVYKGKHIFYSLGNAVFNMPWVPARHGLVLTIDLSGKSAKVESNPLIINDDGIPEQADYETIPFDRRTLDALVMHNQEDELYFKETAVRASQYTKVNRVAIIRRLVQMPLAEQFKIIGDFVSRRILHKD